MTLIKRFGCSFLQRTSGVASAHRSLHITSYSQAGAWHRDWKPAPFPETKKQREAAAKKYGLRVEDYETYDPDKEPGYGDYPKVPWVGSLTRDPYQHYDYGSLKHNYGEIWHKDADSSTADRYDTHWHEHTYYSRNFMLAAFCSVVFGSMFLHFLCEYYGIYTHLPAMPKQFPNNLWIERGFDPTKCPPAVHYTFEPAGKEDCNQTC